MTLSFPLTSPPRGLSPAALCGVVGSLNFPKGGGEPGWKPGKKFSSDPFRAFLGAALVIGLTSRHFLFLFHSLPGPLRREAI